MSARHRQSRLELRHGVLDSALREPEPPEHDAHHRAAEVDVERLGEVEGVPGVLAPRHPRPAAPERIRATASDARASASPRRSATRLKYSTQRAIAGTTDSSDVRQ